MKIKKPERDHMKCCLDDEESIKKAGESERRTVTGEKGEIMKGDREF